MMFFKIHSAIISSLFKGFILPVIISVLIVMFVTIITYSGALVKQAEEQFQQIEHLQNEIAILKKSTQIDSTRYAGIKMVISVMDSLKIDLDAMLKYEMATEIYEMSLKYKINIRVILAVIIQESAFNINAVSHKGAIGIMQIMPSTGKFLAEQEAIEWHDNVLFDPLINIRLGCRYLSFMSDIYGIGAAIIGYNSGPNRARLWNKNNSYFVQLPEETQQYALAVSKHASNLGMKGLYGKTF